MKKHYLVKRKKGQLIIFGVLIFPVIFFCLAMVINVGMVVHDKINLQNSVDLAAIYAAQKQAEVMDAMAHINYQMRQSYKLLAWRYLVLGNSGAFVNPTLAGFTGMRTDVEGTSRGIMNLLKKPSTTSRSLCPNAGTGCLDKDCNINPTTRRWQCPYAVCTIHPLFRTEWYTDNTHVCQNYKITSSAQALPPETPTVGLLPTLSVLIGNDRVRRLREKLKENCSDVGFQNWLVATSMYLSFLEDQRERKLFIENTLFDWLKNGLDIERQPIAKGVENTIRKNLTYVNYRGFNSPKPPHQKMIFSIVESKPSGPAPLSSSTVFTNLYKWDEIAPVPFYVQNTQPGTEPPRTKFCKTTVQSIFQCDPNGTSPYLRPDPSEVDSLAMKRIVTYQPEHEPITWCRILQEVWRNGSRERVSSFYKEDPSHNLGVKVEVEIPYEGQLFFPFFTNSAVVPMTLKAVAYAKPFGASFGPSNPKQQDPRIPRAGLPPFMLFPNYSRFPGDLLGLTDERVQWAWNFLFTGGVRSISQGSSAMREKAKNQGRTFNNYSDLPNNMDFYRDAMVLQHTHVEGPTDSVVVDLTEEEIFNKRMRVYEEMAIAPDQFDLTYYTILPNYMVTLYPKLKKVLGPDEYVPADLGHFRNSNATLIPQPLIYTSSPTLRSHNPQFRLNYIERQIIYAKEQPKFLASLGVPGIFNYKVSGIDQLLTSWAPDQDGPFANSVEMYNTPPLGDCPLKDESVNLTFGGSSDPFLEAEFERKMIPSHCLKGGRTGFSVKLIDPSAL